MNRRIANITIVVRDYDEAIAYYTGALRFELVESAAWRWEAVCSRRACQRCGDRFAIGEGRDAGAREPRGKSDRRPRVLIPVYRRLLRLSCDAISLACSSSNSHEMKFTEPSLSSKTCMAIGGIWLSQI